MDRKAYARVDYIPFKGGKMVAAGGYGENITKDNAVTEAKQLLGFYGYDSVSVEANGVIVARVVAGRI